MYLLDSSVCCNSLSKGCQIFLGHSYLYVFGFITAHNKTLFLWIWLLFWYCSHFNKKWCHLVGHRSLFGNYVRQTNFFYFLFFENNHNGNFLLYHLVFQEWRLYHLPWHKFLLQMEHNCHLLTKLILPDIIQHSCWNLVAQLAVIFVY